MADNTPLIPTEPDWDGTPLSRTEEILYSIIHSEEWDGTPLSRGEYLLLQVKDTIENNSMLDIKGRVDSVEDLPATGNKKGDVYSVGPESQLNRPEYYWDGDSWEYLGQLVDLSGYLPLTGGTMSGPIEFNLDGNKFLRLANYSGDAQVATSSRMKIQASSGIDAEIYGGTITVGAAGAASDKALTYTLSDSSTELWGDKTTVEGVTSMLVRGAGALTLLNGAATGTPNNAVTMNSSGLNVIANHGLIATATGSPSVISSSNAKLTINTSYAAMDIKTNGGSILMQANGGQNDTLTIDGVGAPVTVQSTGAVTIRSPYANGSVGISQGPSGQTSSVNLYGGSVNMNATGSVVATATTGVFANVGSGNAIYNGVDLIVNGVAILSTLNSIQTTIGDINTVLEEVL